MQKVFVNPIAWHGQTIRIIDQTRLPVALKYVDCRSVSEVWDAIKKLKVRGAPLIGIAAALGFYLGMQKVKARTAFALRREARRLRQYLASSRPTAVNLSWALEGMESLVKAGADEGKKKLLVL
ncbi:MAG: S-methyl-5-thioribose-1-phosphate isomerase, partial [Candidatus Omnitrophota bacterium]